MPSTEGWTIGRLLQWTSESSATRRFFRATRRRGAVRRNLHRPRIECTPVLTKCREDGHAQFRELVRRRAAGEPVAYLVGHREFFSLPFEITPDVLIPRPETEFVVITLLDAARAYNAGDRELQIADVGTGSGIIATCAAKHLERCRVTAIDISPAALEVARRNLLAHGVADRVDCLPGPRGSTGRPAAIRLRRVESAVRQRAGTAADAAGSARIRTAHGARRRANGDEIIMRLIPQAAARLVPGGAFVCEISPMLESRVQMLLANELRFEGTAIHKDLAGLPRVVSARRKADD